MQKIKDGFIEIFLQKHCTDSQKKLASRRRLKSLYEKGWLKAKLKKKEHWKQIDWIHLEPLNIVMDH